MDLFPDDVYISVDPPGSLLNDVHISIHQSRRSSICCKSKRKKLSLSLRIDTIEARIKPFCNGDTNQERDHSKHISQIDNSSELMIHRSAAH